MAFTDKIQNADEYYAQTYDDSVPNWPGELAFYRQMARSAGGSVLEIASGTGRVALRLAQDGIPVVGLDLSPKMIEIARKKSCGTDTVRWVEGDMRSFELGERFALVLIPGHSFQNINSPADQVATLECIGRHLNPGGVLVVHLDHMNTENMRWLGDLCGDSGGTLKPAEQIRDSETGNQISASRAWWYEPATQTATVQTVWEERDEAGRVLSRVERRPIRLHCVFRFEMAHLLARTGYQVEAVYGDFFRQSLQDDSPGMIWVAKRPGGPH